MRAGLIAVALLLAAGCGSSRHEAAAPQRPSLPTKAGAASVARLRCPQHPVTTVDMEACAGREQLGLNARFDKEVAALWPILDTKGRRDFVAGQRAWNSYMSQECDVAARAFLGGTVAGPIAGDCFVRLTRARVEEVAGVVADYCEGKVRTGAFRRCPRR
jgi:uncharacterized protein YecT (DUF1311 family)